MNITIFITRDSKPITVEVDVTRKTWLNRTSGFEALRTVFAPEDTEGRFPMILSHEEAHQAEDAAESIWEAEEPAQAAHERRIEAETLAFEARRERMRERFEE